MTSLVGCDDTPAAPAPPIEDQALECLVDVEASEAGAGMDGGAPLTCPSGEVCVLGRCYAECSDDAECGPRETCSSGGICVRRVGPAPDAGPGPDAGPLFPCDGVMCADPEVCHPQSGQCGQCSEDTVGAASGEPGACAGLQPVCDVANGRCVERLPAQCEPCNATEDCDSGGGAFVGTCASREALGWREQVCLQTCDLATPCPNGLTCDGGSCVPIAGESCTTWRAAVSRTACTADDDCNPAGSRGASVFFVSACEGEVVPPGVDAGVIDGGGVDGGAPDGGAITPGVCAQPCGSDTDCSDQATQTCEDTGGGLRFCVP